LRKRCHIFFCEHPEDEWQ